MNSLTVADAAYIAGMIDGEGCISVGRTSTNAASKGCKRGYSYRASMVMNLTDLALLTWMREVTGVGQINERKVSGNRRPAWCWSVWSKDSAELVSAVLPYLKLKTAQAENLNAFQALMRQPGRNGLSDAEWDQREQHYANSRVMNKRGIY